MDSTEQINTVSPQSEPPRLALPYCPQCLRSTLAPSRFDHRYRDMLDLMSQWNIQIPACSFNSGTAKWRLIFPNVGELDGFPHFGRVLILATNGILAYFDTGNPDELFLAHVAAFNGPIAREYVWETDWDYERRRRKVNVYRRADGTYAIIPTDYERDSYWSKHKRYTDEEKTLLESLGYKQIDYHDFYIAWEQLQERQATGEAAPKVKRKTESRKQRALDLL